MGHPTDRKSRVSFCFWCMGIGGSRLDPKRGSRYPGIEGAERCVWECEGGPRGNPPAEGLYPGPLTVGVTGEGTRFSPCRLDSVRWSRQD